jgi:hypothetical protein
MAIAEAFPTGQIIFPSHGAFGSMFHPCEEVMLKMIKEIREW